MKKISAGTIARTIILFVALVNQGLSIAGKAIIPIADEDIEQVVSLVFTIVTTLIAWWKNNSITQNAIAADEYLVNLRKEGK